MKYTEEQKQRALKKFARAYGKWNNIEKNDHITRADREFKFHKAGFEVIKKFGVLNDYYLGTGDARAKK